MDGNLDALDAWANQTLSKTKSLKSDNPAAREKILRASKRAQSLGYDIPDDVAEEFYDLTSHESGRSHFLKDGKTVKTGVKTPNGDFAIGFSQVMGNTAKPYQSKGLDPYKEEDNLIIGLNEFYNGDKSDPVARRLAYVGGGKSAALREYKQTGKVSDAKLYSYLPNNKETYADYVNKSGGFKKLDSWAENTLSGNQPNENQNLNGWADGVLANQSATPAPVAEDVQPNLAPQPQPDLYAATPDQKIAHLTAYRQTVSDELVRAKTMPRRKILQTRLAQMDAQLKAAQAEKQAMPQPPPTNPVNPAPETLTAPLNPDPYVQGVADGTIQPNQPRAMPLTPRAQRLQAKGRPAPNVPLAPTVKTVGQSVDPTSEQLSAAAQETAPADNYVIGQNNPAPITRAAPIEAKNDADILTKGSAGAFDIDLAKKPKGVSAGDYLDREAFRQIAPQYGITNEEIDKFIAAHPDNSAFKTVDDAFIQKSASQTDGKYPVTVNVANSAINEILQKRAGGNLNEINPALRTEIGLKENTIGGLGKNQENIANERAETEAEAKTRAELLNPSTSAGIEKSLQKGLQTAGQTLISPIYAAYKNIRDVGQEIENQFLSDDERIAPQLEAIRKQYGGKFAEYQKDRDYYNQMSIPETASRMLAETGRGIVKTAVSDVLKGADFLDAIAEQYNPILQILPDSARPTLRNLGNGLAYSIAYLQDPNKAKSLQFAKSGDDVDKRLFYNIGKYIDEELGEDKYLKDRFLGQISNAAGSGIGFVLMGFVAPEASLATRLGEFSLTSAALGGVTSAGSGYDEAKGQGLTEEQAKANGVINGVLGLTEGFGLGASLNRAIKNASLRKVFLSNFIDFTRRTGGKILKGSGEEALQEFVQSTGGRIALDVIKDKDPSSYERVLNIVKRLPAQAAETLAKDVPVAALTGGVFEGAAHLATNEESNSPRVDFKNNIIEVEGQRFNFSEETKPTVESWVNQQKGIDAVYAEMESLRKKAKKATTSEQREIILKQTYLLQNEAAVLSERDSALMRKIEKDLTPIGQTETTSAPGELSQTVEEQKSFPVTLGAEEELAPVAKSDVLPISKDATPEKVEKPAQEFSSTQVNLPKAESEKVLSVGRNLIKDEDVHPEEGREDNPHITLKFGLHTNESAEVAQILANEKPFEVALGKTSIFPAKEGANYDVVKVDAFSPELHRLNKLIADNTETTDTHPTFQPHVTLAYVKAGEGEKYAGKADLEGTKLTFNSIAFSDKNRNQVEIPLSGKSLPENAKDIPPDKMSEKVNILSSSEPAITNQQQAKVDSMISKGATVVSQNVNKNGMLHIEYRREGDNPKHSLRQASVEPDGKAAPGIVGKQDYPKTAQDKPENITEISEPSPRTEKEKKINNELRGRTHKAVGAIFGKNIAETYSKSNLSPAAEMSAPIRILKKIVTRDSDEHKAYQQQLALNPDKVDLIPEVESLVKGDEVQMSLEAGEISRVVSAVINNENIETASLIGGLFIGEDGVASFAQVLNDLADVAEQNGVDRRPLDVFRDNILEAAAENGTVILSVFLEAVPHERLHQSRYLNTAEKEISGRYADFNKVFETESDTKGQSINQKAFEAYFKDAYFAGKAFEDLSAFEKAELHEEAFAATARGDYERLGLSDEEAARFLEADLDSYVAKNGDKILDDIERYFDERVKTFDTIRRVREGRTSGRDSKSDTSLQGEEGGKPGRDAGLRTLPESEARAVESNEPDDPSGQSGKLKTRQTILSAEESGAIEKGAISGEARYYEQKSRTESEREAQDKIERDGLARAFADSINPNTPPTAARAALQLETVKLLNRQADEATAAGNPIAAQAKLNQSLEIMLALAPEATNAGQFISQLASMNKTNPDTVAGYVQKSRAKKNYHESLTPEQSHVLRETAESLQKADEQLLKLENHIAEIEKQLADEGETKQSVQTKHGKTKPLSSVEKSIAQNLQSKAEEAAVRLKDQFNLSVKKSNPILKMASPIKSPITITQAAKLDAETLNDLSTVGAEMLLSGLKGNPITIVDFKRLFFEQFGESVRPYLSEIHALSVKELQKIKKGAYRARAVETLRSITGNEDLTLEDLSAIVEKQIEERKEKAKIRAEHTTAADRFFNIDKIDAKERAREEKEKAKADLPSFAKSLFKVAATENKEVLLGAFYLETGQVKTADELARKLREAFPNLSSREALNASSIAARSRLLAHRDLQNERSKLKSEKTRTEAEVKKVRGERNAAQRQLLNRIKYLENPPAGYFERIGRVQKAFIVAAVQTTVNNFLTAEGSRKLVAVTDLAEVLLNKSLAKAGKEFDYENKLSSETRIQDIFSLPESEDYTVADVVKHYFTDAIFARGIANSVLDEYPTLYEAMFGSYASDVNVVKARTGADGAADWAMQKVEKAAEHVNVLNYLQEFLVRSQEFNYALQLRLGQKGLNLADIIKNDEVAEKISEEDLKYAVHRALQVTFALKPDKTTNFGKLASLYQESVPSILQPYLVTFPNYLYNATKFVSDYAPLIGFAKAGIKTARSNEPFLKSYAENVNPRVAAQQLVGTALFLAALQLVRAAGDDDKWYYLKTPMTDKHGKNYYIDVRGYQPFASMIFLANKFNRYSNDKPMFTDSDAAVSETLEALSGFSSRNIEEGKMLQAIWRGTLGRRGDDRDAERVWYLLQQEFGDRLGGWLRPLKIFKDLVAQFDVSEAKQPDVIDHPFKAGIARSLPFANQLLGLDPKKDFVTGKESVQPMPIFRIFGINIVNPDFHKEIPSKALVMMREMSDRFKSEKDILPEHARKAAVKASLYRAMREAGDNKEEQKKVSESIKRAENLGFLEAGELEFIERQKGLAEMENLGKKLGYEKIGIAFKVASESEKDVLQGIIETKAESANKRRDLTAKDVETIKKFLPEFRIELRPPLTIYEKIKSSTTDEAVELYQDKESDLSDRQKEDFKSFIKQKAENANDAGKLTDNEINNIKKVIPDFQILRSLPSEFEKMPSEFEKKFESLEVDAKNPQKKVSIKQPAQFADTSKKRGFVFEDIDSTAQLPVDTGWAYGSKTDEMIYRAGKRSSNNLRAYRQSGNVEDARDPEGAEYNKQLMRNTNDTQSVIEIFDNAGRDVQSELLPYLRDKSKKASNKRERQKYEKKIDDYLDRESNAQKLEKQGVTVDW